MRHRAYTFVELLVTVALLSLLASFIVPTYELILAQFELSSTTSQVADFIRLTEQKTVTEQVIYGVTLTAGATTITQFLYDPVAQTKTTQTTYTLPSNMSIGAVGFSGNSDIRFSTFGAPSTNGTLTITDGLRSKSRNVVIGPSGAISNNQGEF